MQIDLQASPANPQAQISCVVSVASAPLTALTALDLHVQQEKKLKEDYSTIKGGMFPSLLFGLTKQGTR